MLGKSPIKWRQHPDMTITVDWDVKHQFKQILKQVQQVRSSLVKNEIYIHVCMYVFVSDYEAGEETQDR